MAISQVSLSVETSDIFTVSELTVTYDSTSAGNLLVMRVAAYDDGGSVGTITFDDVNWQPAAQAVSGDNKNKAEIWYYVNNPGELTSTTVSISENNMMAVTFTEYSGTATDSSVVDVTATTRSFGTDISITAGDNVTDLADWCDVIAVCGLASGSNAMTTDYTDGFTIINDQKKYAAHTCQQLQAIGTDPPVFDCTQDSSDEYAVVLVCWLPAGETTPVDSVGTANGIATANGVGRSAFPSAGSAAGVASASGVGRSAFPSAGSCAGLATASGVGVALFPSIGSAAGIATANGVGVAAFPSAGNAPGVATASGVCIGLFSSVYSAAGLATALGITHIGQECLSASIGLSTISATISLSTLSGSIDVSTVAAEIVLC